MERYDQTQLLTALQHPSIFPHAVGEFQILDTHISRVLLTGPYAYKIKKPVNLGFVDFSTLEQRRFYCEEEIRLNRRLAPHLYIQVIPISGSPQHPRLGTNTPPFEFAVQMRQFSQENRLDHVLERGALRESHIGQLAQDLAHFHLHIARAGATSPYGEPETVWRPVEECFLNFPPNPQSENMRAPIHHLQSWMQRFWTTHYHDFANRKANGYIRECHGDLHLENLVLLNDHATVFDCIEFNESLRWIDVLSEIAFLVMDLKSRNRVDLSGWFFNRYLELTGDYLGLVIFRFYETYRALVRAKVAGIRLAQGQLSPENQQAEHEKLEKYLALSYRLSQTSPPILLLTHGFSGSGKTTVSHVIVTNMDVIRLRSDVERKRLFGYSPEETTPASAASDIYGPEATQKTYDRLAQMTEDLLQSGFSVIVDATFLRARDRHAFSNLAHRLRIPFIILDLIVTRQELRQRIRARMGAEGEASEATLEVLERQVQSAEPLTSDEQAMAIPLRSPGIPDGQALVNEIVRRREKSLKKE